MHEESETTKEMNQDERRALEYIKKRAKELNVKDIDEADFRKWCEEDLIHKGITGENIPVRIAGLYITDPKRWKL